MVRYGTVRFDQRNANQDWARNRQDSLLYYLDFGLESTNHETPPDKLCDARVTAVVGRNTLEKDGSSR